MTGHKIAGDFASAAMMRLVAAGLARQGFAVSLPPVAGAYVPQSQKRHVLEAILSSHGPGAILAIADAARHMPPEPVAQALVRARDIADLLDRWHRVERFSHARHTVETERVSGDGYRLNHRARDDGPPPSVAESLLVIGLLTVLAEMVGSAFVTLTSEAGDVWRENGQWRRELSSLDVTSVILTARSVPVTAPRPEFDVSDDPFEKLRDRLTADPVRRWTVMDISAELGTTPRTLQRRLARRSVSFSRLVADARLQVAASHLCDPQGAGLAEIGFLAGYSDQARFSRSFQQAVGTTPKAFRVNFGPRVTRS